MSQLECNTITLASGSLAVPQNNLTVNGPTPSLILFFATSHRKLSLTPFVDTICLQKRGGLPELSHATIFARTGGGRRFTSILFHGRQSVAAQGKLLAFRARAV